MGLSSSQARLLNLTSRMHQIEYKAAKLEAEKLQMANESTRVYEEYLEALEKTKIQYKVLTTDGSITYQDVANYPDFLKAGYALDFDGTVVNVSELNADGTVKTALGTVGYFYAIPDATDNTKPATGSKYYGANNKPAGATLKIPATIDNLYKALGITSVSSNFENVLTNMINSGEVTIVAAKKDGKFVQESEADFINYETSVATNTGLQEVTDEINLKKAEAKYEADMFKIDKKDRKFDSDLAALDAERNAIKQEMETLKSVAKENVERTFKLFS